MRYPPSELIDRLSILMLKKERGNYDCEDEINEFKTALKNFQISEKIIEEFLHDLHTVNEKIWDLEADIRLGKEHELGLEEVGERALKIRNLNKERIRLKNGIVEKVGVGFTEKKFDHASD